MLKRFLRDRGLLLLLFTALAVKLFSLREAWVERWYTYGFYPAFSRLLRLLFGWIPFSLGDLLYAFAFVWLLRKVFRAVKRLARRQYDRLLLEALVRKYLKLVLWIYLVFNLFWGLNYNRAGIAGQLGLDVQPYGAEALTTLATVLQQRLNAAAPGVDSLERLRLDRDNAALFQTGIRAYEQARDSFPFLAYRSPSIKPSLYSPVGHLFGFTGYYNPFTAEAQLKLTVPVFVKPFVLCHEMAHQVGYAKENEANLVAFFAGRHSANPEFRYSAYFDVYLYAIRELARFDTAAFQRLRRTVHPQVKKDYGAYQAYLLRSQNVMEPVMSEFYDRYLKLNNQPKGKGSYNEVVAWLVAYVKRYGVERL